MEVKSYMRISTIFFLGVLFFFVFFIRIGAACDFSMTAEACLKAAQVSLDQFDNSLSLNQRKVLKETAFSEKDFLSPSLRLAWEERSKIKEDRDLWIQVVALKKAILELDSKNSSSKEADKIAHTVIQSFKEQRQEYKMIRPAVLHNMFVNTGFKKEGFCWHWARDLLKRLNSLELNQYRIQWGTAYEGKLREHNCLVVIPKGGKFEEGLVLDGWRKSGKPYWCRVNKDHYPWKFGEYAGE